MSGVAVAASGGRDSTALLHATARAGRALGIEVHALHVHHGLAADADDWLQHVRAQCRRWSVVFHAVRLAGAPAKADSVEAWARRERYRALAAMAADAGCSLVLLAQHRRDQAETVLLQALRGAGPAAMRRVAVRDGITWARPWLDRPREAVEAYLRRHRLRWVDDGSNDDLRFARNLLRHDVWPALTAAFPDAEAQLRAAAERAVEAASCLDELAAIDLAAVADGDGALDIARLGALSPARRGLLLRAWLRPHGAVPESLLRRLVLEVSCSKVARWPMPGGELRLHDGRLRHHAAAAIAPAAGRLERPLDLGRAGIHVLADLGGRFVVESAASGGLSPAQLTAAVLRARSGGERFQFAPGALPRSLKKQYQARRIPAWDRNAPLLWSGGELLYVPGLGIDARAIAPAGTPQLTVRWQADN